MDTNEGEAVTIVDVEDENLKVNFEALAKILKNDNIKDLPVAIVSVAGDFRIGKSFLLNLFLRYLDRKSVEGKQGTDVDDGIGCRFDWKSTTELVTTGIQMWSKPYIVEIEGKRVAILLIDTQGNNDMKARRIVKYKIFAVSTLMSSIQLYNVPKQLQLDTFEHLQAFMTYAASCNSDKKFTFQELTFIIRDWQKSRPEKHGFEGGKKYLDGNCMEAFQSYMDAEGRTIHDVFKTVRCFLLPYPGEAVDICHDSKDLIFKDIKKEFLNHVDDLADGIFSTLGLIKQFKVDEQTDEVTGEKLYLFLKMIAAHINSEKLPVHQTVLECMIRSACDTGSKEAIKLFKDSITEISAPPEKGDFIKWEDFNMVIKVAEEKALEKFDESYGSSSEIGMDCKMSLQNDLETIKTKLHENNNEKGRINKECEKRVVGAIAMFRTITSQVTDPLEKGGFEAWDILNKSIENATLKAKDHFNHGYGKGSEIHQKFLNDLNSELESITEYYKDKNIDNKRITDECEKLMKEAIPTFERAVSEIVKKLEDGQVVATDDDTLVKAKCKGLKDFEQTTAAGTAIHQRFKVKLTAKLDEIIQRHCLKNSQNKRVTEACEKRVKQAIAEFNKHFEKATEQLRQGYSVENDDIFETATLQATVIFRRNYDSESIIHQRYHEKLTRKLETDVDRYKRENDENKRIIQACKEKRNEAEEHYSSHIKVFRKKMDEGYFEKTNTTDDLLEHAKSIALSHFGQSYESGSIIHKRYERELKMYLETEMEKHKSSNSENSNKYDKRKKLFEKLEKELSKRLQAVDDLIGYERKLLKVHNDVVRKLSVYDYESKALKKLRNETLEGMDEQRLNREEQIRSKNKSIAINSAKTVSGIALVVGGACSFQPEFIALGCCLCVGGAGSAAWGIYGLVTGKRVL